MIFGLLRKINTAQPVRQGGLWDVYPKTILYTTYRQTIVRFR